MEPSPIRTASHIGLWIIVAGIGIWLIYSATHTHNERNTFAPGSTSNENHIVRWPLTIDLNLSCVPPGLNHQYDQSKSVVNAEVKK